MRNDVFESHDQIPLRPIGIQVLSARFSQYGDRKIDGCFLELVDRPVAMGFNLSAINDLDDLGSLEAPKEIWLFVSPKTSVSGSQPSPS